MGSSIRNILLIQRFFIVIAIFALVLVGCGEAEDPVVEATGNAPVVENFGAAYLKRPATALNMSASQATNFPVELDANDPTVGVTPGDVYIRDLSSGTNQEENITDTITAPQIADPANISNGDKSAGDVSDLEVSYDGSMIVFSMHEGMYVGLMDEEQPTWNIWIYDLNAPAGQGLRRVIQSDIEASLGNDVDPHFLPDGRIVFTSDRRDRERFINLDLYGDEYITINERNDINSGATAYALHVMDSAGGNIKQITFNQSNDLNPTVLNNGKILFSRWDGLGPRNELNLYTVNPDGTELDLHYGAHSHDTDNDTATATQHYADAKQMPDGTLVGMFLEMANARGRGQIISIDHENFVEYNQKRFTSPSLSTQGHVLAIDTPILPNAITSLAGNFTTPHPIYEAGQTDRLLLSWEPCRLTDPNSGMAIPCDPNNIIDNTPNVADVSDPQLADPLFGVWIQELDSTTRGRVALPEVDNIAITNPVALINRPVAQRPAVILDKTPLGGELDPDMAGRYVGAISIKSVYDTVGNVAMVDRPLEPRSANNLLVSERALIPMTTIEMDAVTGAVVTNPSDTNVVPVTRTVADIAAIRTPTVTNTADNRVARFIRINKAVPKVDLPGNPLNNDDFGRTGGYEMREILGYTQVEPDGSVFVEVPAEVPFTISVLDAKGRSLMSHTSWMQVMPGEVKVCGGCHSPSDGQAPVNIGATTPSPFPNTVGFMTAEVGETMAETRARLDCLAGCTYQRLKRDLIYDDPWTDPALAGRPADASFTIGYDPNWAMVVPSRTPITNPGSCNDTTWEWDGTFCRISINFPDHIQPILDDRCISCHNDNVPNALPPGNLVLESQIDPATSPRLQAYRDARTDTDRLASYEFLFVTRPRMEVDPAGGRRFIVERDPVTGEPIDVDGNPIGETDIDNLQFINPRPGLVSQGVARARHSPLLYVLTGDSLVTGTEIATPLQDHTGLLSPEELRLIIEWTDNGTQNFNNLNSALTN
jgi:hypothetical protein